MSARAGGEEAGAEGRLRADRPVRVGIVGCGRAAETFHLPALGRISGVTVVAAADPDPGRLAAVAGRFGIRQRYDSHGALLAESDADAVLVAVPPAHHEAVALDVLSAGRHLLLEKPIALDREAARRLADAGGAADAVAMTGFNLRWHPVVRDARELLAGGTLGPIRAVRSIFTTASDREVDGGSWRARPGEGGGVLLDLAVHHFDLIGHLLGGEAEEVVASARGAVPEDADAAVVAGRLSNGVLVSGLYARGAGDANVLEVRGRYGTARLSLYAVDGLGVDLDRGSPVRLAGRARLLARRVERVVRAAAALPRGGPFRASYEGEWRAFIDCVRGGHRPSCSLADGARALEIVLAALEAAGRGAPVRPASVG